METGLRATRKHYETGNGTIAIKIIDLVVLFTEQALELRPGYMRVFLKLLFIEIINFFKSI